jgi:hypothetical protein
VRPCPGIPARLQPDSISSLETRHRPPIRHPFHLRVKPEGVSPESQKNSKQMDDIAHGYLRESALLTSENG